MLPEKTQGNTDWFVHDRFGMFIHWGLYSLAARHEWVQSQEKIAPDVYERRYLARFDPVHYDPREWARAARAAGMKYAVITSKHHEGFCLWDTQYTDYKATNTPYGKDLLVPFVEAFRAEGLKVGFYYSLLDWHHPDFPIDIHHPLRDAPDVAELNRARLMPHYAEYVRNQVTELLTNFQPDILWCDFSYPTSKYKGLPGKGHLDWESEALVELIRRISPSIILNNRLDLPAELADVHTPEQIQPAEWVKVEGKRVVWEACQTFSGSWGYHRDEASWKEAGQLIRMLVNCVSCGGNLLMNVGPTALGTFDARAVNALAVYRDWIELNGEAIYGCSQSEFTPPPDCRLTQKEGKVFIHVYAWPFRSLIVPGLQGRVEYARLLNDGSEIPLQPPGWEANQLQYSPEDLVLWLPVKQPDTIVPVIELTLKK